MFSVTSFPTVLFFLLSFLKTKIVVCNNLVSVLVGMFQPALSAIILYSYSSTSCISPSKKSIKKIKAKRTGMKSSITSRKEQACSGGKAVLGKTNRAHKPVETKTKWNDWTIRMYILKEPCHWLNPAFLGCLRTRPESSHPDLIASWVVRGRDDGFVPVLFHMILFLFSSRSVHLLEFLVIDYTAVCLEAWFGVRKTSFSESFIGLITERNQLITNDVKDIICGHFVKKGWIDKTCLVYIQ